MRLWLLRLLLIALLPWQGVAWAATALTGSLHEETHHAAAHWLGEAHHHDAHDGSGLHHDDSAASALHMMQVSAQTTPAAVLPMGLECVAVQPAASVPDGISLLHCPRPYLEGLRRPPRRIG